MAITTTADDVICIAPELEGQESRVTKFIEFAKARVSEAAWGDKANFATALLTAHMITSLGRAAAGTTGEIKKKKVGDNMIEYATQTLSERSVDDEYLSTAYGREYLSCRKQLVLTPAIAGC